MAGRPAAGRGGGGTLYGLIVFAILSVAFLGLFIWQFTANKRLAEEASSAQRRLQHFGSAPSYYEAEATNRGTSVLAAMNRDMQDLAALVVGKKDVVWPAIKQEADRLLGEIAAAYPDVLNPQDPLLTAVTRLYGALRDMQQRAEQAESDLAELRAENERLSNGVKAARQEFEQQIASLQAELKRVQEETAAQLKAKDEQLSQFQARAASLEEQLNRERVERQQADRLREIEIARLQRQRQELLAKLEELNPSEFDPYKILKKADGKILRAIPGSDVVFINIGARDRVKPGLSFEVFSPFGERANGFRGKASIEVTAVTEDTAECRVTRQTPGRPIVEGDLIVNIAYEPKRAPRFVVRGEFDLDYDGVADLDGVERIESMVRAWGGQVVDQVDQSTDFVVLGLGPSVPSFSSRRQVSAVFEELARTQAERYREYEQVVEKARTLNIPIITQNQFLFLTGYAGQEEIVRR